MSFTEVFGLAVAVTLTYRAAVYLFHTLLP